MKRLFSKRGFTLIEAVVTTGVVGILVGVAFPLYNKYVYKAKQNEPRTALAALYAAMTTFKAQYDDFCPRFDVNGFAITGQLRYRTGFVSDRAPPPQVERPGNASCIITSNGGSMPACDPGYPQQYIVTGMPTGAASITAMPGPPITADNFTAFSLGRADDVTIDSWSIDEKGAMLSN